MRHGRADADLSSLDEVRRFAASVGEVDLLVNNAGLVSMERQLSADGYELCFAVNYLAGFLLWHELRPPRVVNVASVGQQAIDFDDVMLEHGYDPARAYSQSKLAQILFTFELAERAPDGVTADCLHPATFMDTDMVRQIRGPGNAQSTVAEGADAVMHVIDSARDRPLLRRPERVDRRPAGLRRRGAKEAVAIERGAVWNRVS